jgi:hypothetical protein
MVDTGIYKGLKVKESILKTVKRRRNLTGFNVICISLDIPLSTFQKFRGLRLGLYYFM